MRVRDILDEAESFPTIATDETVAGAARVMSKSGVRAVPVVEGETLLGIVTDWDIVEAFAQQPDGLGDLAVSSIMTKDDLITVELGASIVEATKQLQDNRVHHLLVVEGKNYKGVICLGLEWTEEGMLTPPGRPTLTARRP